MGSVSIGELEPSIQVPLKCIDGFTEGLFECDAEEPVQNGSVQPCDKALGLGRLDPCSSGLDPVDGEGGL